MTVERKQRFEETRATETRDAEIRRHLRMEFKDRFYVDVTKIPDGMEYHWVRDTIYNEPDEARFIEMQRKGWVPVPSDRHPERQMGGIPWRETKARHGFIIEGGLVLCERPKEYGDIEREMERAYNMRVVNEAPGLDASVVDPTNARVFANQTSFKPEI
jgi:hypothetical protein